MKVLVDTPIWSLALRRRPEQLGAPEKALVDEWKSLLEEGRVLVPGAVRQEVLSGIATSRAFEVVRSHLRHFPDLEPTIDDHEDAARCFNICRSRGIAGSAIDMLICALARRRDAAIFTTDADFRRYASPLGLALHVGR